MQSQIKMAKIVAYIPFFLVFAATGTVFGNPNFPGINQTPVGAERGPNRDGTIPEWKGGLTEPPEGYTEGEYHIDPFEEDDVKFIISARNLEDHRTKLTDLQKALLEKYPEKFVINVFPTRRSCSYPEFIYEATAKNANTAKVIEQGYGFSGASAGFPFPEPKNAFEVLFNHETRYSGLRYSAKTSGGTMNPNGTFTKTVRQDRRLAFYHHPDYSSPELDNRYYVWRAEWTDPPLAKGQAFSATNTINQIKQPRFGFMWNPDTQRVFTAPSSSYQYTAPMMTSQGMRISDDMFLFNGAPDQYDWKLVGKKEIYIPYNSYPATNPNLKLNDLLLPGFLNPEHIRYELHRVWVIEGELKPGKSHKFAKRTLYFDEDSWIAVASDLFDQNNTLTHGQFGFVKNYYEHPTCIQDFDVLYELGSGRYNVDNLKLEYGPANLNDPDVTDRSFGSGALRRSGSR
mgnify:CR=1 FL=1